MDRATLQHAPRASSDNKQCFVWQQKLVRPRRPVSSPSLVEGQSCFCRLRRTALWRLGFSKLWDDKKNALWFSIVIAAVWAQCQPRSWLTARCQQLIYQPNGPGAICWICGLFAFGQYRGMICNQGIRSWALNYTDGAVWGWLHGENRRCWLCQRTDNGPPNNFWIAGLHRLATRWVAEQTYSLGLCRSTCHQKNLPCSHSWIWDCGFSYCQGGARVMT